MPVLLVTSNTEIDGSTLDRLAGIVGRAIDAPPSRVMVLSLRAEARMAGTSDPAVLVELRCVREIGLEQKRNLVESVVNEVAHSLVVGETRIYVQIESHDAVALWSSAGGVVMHAGPRL